MVMHSMGRDAEVSTSFGSLRLLADTFPVAATLKPAARRRTLALARSLGDVAMPLLARKLRDDDDEQASWAYWLLAQLGGARAVDAARRLALDDAASDGKKALALALLGELGAELPDHITLRDPESLRAESVRDLVASLIEPADVARTIDLLVEQVGPPDLPPFLGEMVDVAGGAVAPLIDEALGRDDLPRDVLDEIRELREKIEAPAPAPAPPRGRVNVVVGRHPDGRRAVLAARRRRGSDPPRLRALLLEIGGDGRLGAVRYDDDLPPGWLGVLRRELASSGFAVAPDTRREASYLAAAAARATRAAGRSLPREYYLGRDLFGLGDEHLRAPRDDAAPDLLGRASALLDRGRADRALTLTARYVQAFPEDAEGRSLHGSCLLEAGKLDEALAELAAAARLEPDEPLHHWNLSHAAKKAGKLGACYLALADYLRGKDRSPGAASRARTARSFMRLFERFARLEHPDATAVAVARAEELFERATRHLDANRLPEAVAGFEAVLKLVPSHYPSWSNLGVAYANLRRPAEAERCLRKALDFRPDYEVARKNLASLVK